MREELLHYLWKHRLFANTSLTTLSGETIQVADPGQLNSVSGPDFSVARVRIGPTLWAGNVEIHVRSSDWYAHGHQHDPAYRRVILHVVHTHDLDHFPQDIPVLELRELMPQKIVERYETWLHNSAWIPCGTAVQQVEEVVRDRWLDHVLLERLERKTTEVFTLLQQHRGDWEAVAYRMLLQAMGFRHNTPAFDALGRALPFGLIRKHQHELRDLEALLFGAAGFLQGKFTDAYPRALQQRFRYFRIKYDLPSCGKEVLPWKFGGLRPSNFPSVRIAQAAGLLYASRGFADLRETASVETLLARLKVAASSYWKEHYRFEQPVKSSHSTSLGIASRRLVVINAWVPLVFAYGRHYRTTAYQERVFQWLRDLPPESNRTVDHWKSLLLNIGSMARSQALLELKSAYCDEKRCLRCGIGSHVLNESV